MESAIIELSVAVDIKGNRLDKFLAYQLCGFSRNKIQSMIISGCVSIDGRVIINVNYILKIRQRISICQNLDLQKSVLSADETVKFSILYEDNDLIVINKPAGVVVHPGAGNYEHTLVNGLAYYYGQFLSSGSDEYRPGIVHRIDKGTSGILVVAKNDHTHSHLTMQFQIHSIKRKYICFCYGVPAKTNGKIDTFIGRDRKNRLKMAVVKDPGKRAITFYRTLKVFSRYASKVECELHTGRTHQIRVHMSHMGHSLIGDSLYKAKNYSIPADISKYIYQFSRQALHAYLLEFIHPTTGKTMHFETDLPEDMMELEKIML